MDYMDSAVPKRLLNLITSDIFQFIMLYKNRYIFIQISLTHLCLLFEYFVFLPCLSLYINGALFTDRSQLNLLWILGTDRIAGSQNCIV